MGQEATRVAPLQNKDGFIQNNAQARANILIHQFDSAFTAESTTAIPDKGLSEIHAMASITVDWKEVHKFLKNLKPHKATGPDAAPPPFILKTEATELAPALMIMRLSDVT